MLIESLWFGNKSICYQVPLRHFHVYLLLYPTKSRRNKKEEKPQSDAIQNIG
jgi:hypothetical protein